MVIMGRWFEARGIAQRWPRRDSRAFGTERSDSAGYKEGRGLLYRQSRDTPYTRAIPECLIYNYANRKRG
jgi:hypothetical protein